MIDFKKKLGIEKIEKKINPYELYESLDRRSEIGPLRPSQKIILSSWFEDQMGKKDIIVKLHTGEGKTLIGLLMLQSKINQGKYPCVYICPNINLCKQTCLEAEKFGIPYCLIDESNAIPDDCLNGKKILITHVQKIFNGKTIFGLDNRCVAIDTIVLDDSHACIEVIRNAFTIRITKEHNRNLYEALLELFAEDMKGQGEGSFYEISTSTSATLLPIPYWSLVDKKSEVLTILNKYKEDERIKFSWPLIKNNIDNCQAFFSGHKFELSMVYVPIQKFGSFNNASQRILMSATTQDDSFLIKGLGFGIESIKYPLTNDALKWSGEKMILIPSLINNDLDRDFVVNLFSKPDGGRKYGIVAITPDFKSTSLYEQLGAKIVKRETINSLVESLKNKCFSETIVFANRYDGIDLPDESCRVLILDTMPFFASLSDRYEEECRTNSDIINIKLAQKIEQGMGRSVRGEKDYSVIIIIGADLVKFIKSPLTSKYFSPQARKQIKIGLAIAGFAKEDNLNDAPNETVLISLINQALERDEGWKKYYKDEMNKDDDDINVIKIYDVLEKEKMAEEHFYFGKYEKASELMQELCDAYRDNPTERGWYIQQLARYKYPLSKIDSSKTQKSAFELNYQLLKPRDGIKYNKLQYINENRIKRIRGWVNKFNTYDELLLSINEIINNFSFGILSDKFEKSLFEIGILLGFISQRPDKEYKKGPDSLWCGIDNTYIFFECKSEVRIDRNEISKDEAGQMNVHCAWFENEYGVNVKVKRILIIPTNTLSYYADFTHEVKIMRQGKLREFKKAIVSFSKEFKKYDIHSLSDEKINEMLEINKLGIEDIYDLYCENYRKSKNR